MRRVGVVIPYYQRDPGLLLRAVKSVADQKLPNDVRLTVVVVDDGSPLPAEQELSDFSSPHWCDLIILHQLNSGPGAARNAGLNRLPSTTNYVAFLDSDDIWYPDHLRSSLRFLKRSDFHFSNILEESARTDWFSYSSYIARHHRRRSVGVYVPAARFIEPAEAFSALLDDLIPPTPQVVYRLEGRCDLRFDTDLRRAGEDRLFWLALSRRSASVSYSTSVQGERGSGISVHRATFSWDSPYGPDRLIDTLISRHRVSSRFELRLDDALVLKRFMHQTRTQLALVMIRHLRTRPLVTLKALHRLMKELPSFFIHAPIALLSVPAQLRRARAEYAAHQGR